MEPAGADRIHAFMADNAVAGFASLDEVADAIAAYNPNRRRPRNLDGLNKNVRLHPDGRWYWHWDPRFMDNRDGIDGQPGIVDHPRLCAAARRVTIPTLLVRGGSILRSDPRNP